MDLQGNKYYREAVQQVGNKLQHEGSRFGAPQREHRIRPTTTVEPSAKYYAEQRQAESTQPTAVEAVVPQAVEPEIEIPVVAEPVVEAVTPVPEPDVAVEPQSLWEESDDAL
jgi:hypothetical protein